MKLISLLGALNAVSATGAQPVLTQAALFDITPSFDYDFLTEGDKKPLTQSVGTSSTGDDSSDQSSSKFDSIEGYDFLDYSTNDKFNRIILSGTFDFHTYSNEKNVSTLTIYKDYASSNADQVVYSGEFQHHTSSGWGRQTSTIGIQLVVKPSHISLPNIVLFNVTARAYAGTSGSVYSAHTNITINSMNFGHDSENSAATQKSLVDKNF